MPCYFSESKLSKNILAEAISCLIEDFPKSEKEVLNCGKLILRRWLELDGPWLYLIMSWFFFFLHSYSLAFDSFGDSGGVNFEHFLWNISHQGTWTLYYPTSWSLLIHILNKRQIPCQRISISLSDFKHPKFCIIFRFRLYSGDYYFYLKYWPSFEKYSSKWKNRTIISFMNYF